MKNALRIALPITLVCLAAAAVGGYLFYQWMVAPLYTPGMIRRGENLSAPLDPPAQTGEPGYWQVEPDIRLHYFAVGEGAPALVIHGGPGYPYTEAWSGLAPLASDRRFYYYDQRGCGQSTRPFDRFDSPNYDENMRALERTLGLGAQVADIERVRRILGVEKIALAGHSFGGFLAALYAAEFPERVESLVLVSPADMLVMPQEHGGLFPLMRERLPESERADFDAFLAAYLDFQNLFSKNEADLVETNRRLEEYYLLAYPDAAGGGSGEPGGWMVWAMYLSMGMRHDYRPAMVRRGFPVLILHGSADMQSEAASRQYLEVFPEARFEVMEGSSHFAFEEQPEEFARRVREFLR